MAKSNTESMIIFLWMGKSKSSTTFTSNFNNGKTTMNKHKRRKIGNIWRNYRDEREIKNIVRKSLPKRLWGLYYKNHEEGD